MYAMTAALDYGIVEDDDGGDYDLAMDALAIERRATEFLLDDDGSTTSEGGEGEGEGEGGARSGERRHRGEHGSNGEFRDASVRYRLLCPTTRIGRVIGKEGRVIKATRAETGARVKVAPTTRGADERVILVASGDDLTVGEDGEGMTTAEVALFRIFDTITGEEGVTAARGGEGEGEGEASGGSTRGAATPICRLLVPRVQVGSLIGKGGTVISAIRASSGATVRVMPANMLPACASQGDELLQITAPSRDADGAERDQKLSMASVKNALRMIAKHLREYPSKNAATESNRIPFEAFMMGNKTAPHAGVESPGAKNGGHMSTRMNLNGVYVPGGTEITFRLLCPVSKTGSVIGRNGEVIQQIRSQTGAKVKVCEQVNGAEERIICVSSSDDGLAPMLAAQVALFRVYRCIVESAGNEIPLPFRLLVQTSQIGCLIGKGGSIIKQIRNETGATVRVLPSEALPSCANDDDELLEIGQWPADACALGIRIVSGRLRGNIRHKAAERLTSTADAQNTQTMGFDATWQQAELIPYGMTQTAYGSPETVMMSKTKSTGGARAPPVEIAPGVSVVNSVQMAISSQHIGSVLGRGGCNISLARQVSGARIKLYPGAAGSRRTADRSVDSDRLLEISGSSEQVASAQDIIQRFIASSGAMLPEFASFTATGKQHEPETAMFVVS
jgi:poly(rC)-binding protein 2/3/4